MFFSVASRFSLHFHYILYLKFPVNLDPITHYKPSARASRLLSKDVIYMLKIMSGKILHETRERRFGG